MSGAVCDGGLGRVGDCLGGRGWLWCGGVGMWVGWSRELEGCVGVTWGLVMKGQIGWGEWGKGGVGGV